MAGSVTVAALRSRPRQAALVAALAAVVTAAAALGPLYARAVEQSVLRHVVTTATPAEATFVVTDSSAPVTSPDGLAEALRPALPPELAAPTAGADAPVTAAGLGARLTTRDDVCAHVHVAVGRCAGAPGEVLLSRRTAAALGTGVGRTLAVSADRVRAQLSVVGLYDGVDPSAAYWAGRPTGTSDARGGRVIDDLLTTWSTLSATPWPELQSHLDSALRPDRVDLRRVAGLRADLAEAGNRATLAGAYATTGIPALLSSADGQRRQARTIIWLLTVQLAVLGLVVLAFVGAAVTEQRRPEIALARLRGLGSGGAAGLLLRELGLLIALGGAAGLALALAVGQVATGSWLAPGVRLELRPAVTGAVLAAVAAGVLGILAAGAPTLRQPLTSLLRRVPPRTSHLRVGLVEGAVVAAAAAGVVTLLAGRRGAVALLAPGLLALAGGLLLSQLVVPLAGPLGRRQLRRGRVPGGLAALQIARRPALRRLIAIVTVACALLVFAVDAWSVASRNRTLRAQVDAGAAVVLTVDATGPQALRSAVLAVDPKAELATPVVWAHSATDAGPRTLAVEPAAFRRIAHWGSAAPPSLDALRALEPHTVDPVRLPAGTSALTVSASYAFTALPRPLGSQAELMPISLVVLLQSPAGAEQVDLGHLRRGRASYTGSVTCTACSLAGFVVQRRFGDAYPVALSLAVEGVRAQARGASVPLDLGPATRGAWQVQPSQELPTTATVAPGPPLTISDPTSFASAQVVRGDVPAVTPALVAGDVPPPFRTTSQATTSLAVGPDLAGSDHLYAVTSRLPLVPRSGSRTVLTSLQALRPTAGAPTGQTSYDVWLARDDPSRERAFRTALAAQGLQVIGRDSTRAHERALGEEGPTLALRLALLAGLVALLLAGAALVVGVATSGTTRARDLAGLRVVGVPLPTLRGAAVLEHLVVAGLGVAAGSALGLVAAQAALPDLPLFAGGSRLLPVVLHPAWGAVLATAVVCLLLLAAVAVLVGRSLAAAAAPVHLRDAA